MRVEAVLLTGGASSRMGQDKASMSFCGEPAAIRIARELKRAACKVTVLGPNPIAGCAHQKDEADHQGPLAALAAFRPTEPYVFVLSCDTPAFPSAYVAFAIASIEDTEGVLAEIDGWQQPLCALYSRSAFETFRGARQSGVLSITKAIEVLDRKILSEESIRSGGIDPRRLASANTPEEWAALEAIATS